MLNPFTYNFFNAALDHFIAPEYTNNVHIIQSVYSGFQVLAGIFILWQVIHLEERSFRNNFKLDNKDPVNQFNPKFKLTTQEMALNDKLYIDIEKIPSQAAEGGKSQIDVFNLTKKYDIKGARAKNNKKQKEEKVREVSFNL